MLVIRNSTIYSPTQVLSDHQITIQNGRISQVAPLDQAEIPDQAVIIDGTGLTVVPGFIDLQFNGAYGHDFTANPNTIWEVSQKIPEYGVTSYLPTIITSPVENINYARSVLASNRPGNYTGAEPLGLHIEGPFLNLQKKGAHNPNYLLKPDSDIVKEWSPETSVRLVTLAPELPGATDVIEHLAANGIVVSAGHSMATFAEGKRGITSGIRYGTHLFNAMTPVNHREPGLPMALLDESPLVVGIIADGIHVHPALIKFVWELKGGKNMNLVTDAMAALGMPPGKYLLNEFEVTVSESECRLADGTLAGARISMIETLQNLMRFTGCSLHEALPTLTTTPADLLGIGAERGRIAAGYIADLVFLDERLEVAKTIAAGKIVFEIDAHSPNYH